MAKRILVAGVGNIFFGDDGFGVEVARRLSARTMPEDVCVADFGVAAVHLAYEMLEHAYEVTILVDAVSRGGEPGTVYLIEPDTSEVSADAAVASDAHTMHPEAVLAWLKRIGGKPGQVLVVGCEPARIDGGIGLSEPVAGAVDEAIALICRLAGQESQHVFGHSGPDRQLHRR